MLSNRAGNVFRQRLSGSTSIHDVSPSAVGCVMRVERFAAVYTIIRKQRGGKAARQSHFRYVAPSVVSVSLASERASRRSCARGVAEIIFATPRESESLVLADWLLHCMRQHLARCGAWRVRNPAAPLGPDRILADPLSCHSDKGPQMQFDRLKRRDFMTLLGGAAWASRMSGASPISVCVQNWRAACDHGTE